ncbi:MULTISPECIES: hypothetical protein [unclassified Roseovarius]|uniref:hypothetical protein n=1 Tax=unclassified Roseovarius TaxID=2614913 RepID=UPI00273DF1A1|nr:MULTISPECIES: hypothetical protein [unclassified Roseovarius]
MSTFSDFLQKAKDDYDRVDADLKALEQKAKDAGDKADAWTKDQAAKLKADLTEARDKVTALAERVEQEGEDAVSEAHDHAKRHWDALHAAVAAYRDHLENTVSA